MWTPEKIAAWDKEQADWARDEARRKANVGRPWEELLAEADLRLAEEKKADEKRQAKRMEQYRAWLAPMKDDAMRAGMLRLELLGTGGAYIGCFSGHLKLVEPGGVNFDPVLYSLYRQYIHER